MGAKESGKDFSYAFSATFIETLTKILIFKISSFYGPQLKSDLEYKDILKGVMSLKTRNQGKETRGKKENCVPNQAGNFSVGKLICMCDITSRVFTASVYHRYLHIPS